MKKLLILLAILGVLLIGAGLFVRSALDPDTLGREVIRRINDAGIWTVEAERFRLDLWKGLSLIDARATANDGTATIALDRLVLEHELRPLLSGRLVARSLVLERPSIALVTRGRPSTSGARARSPAREAGAVEPPPAAGGGGRNLSLEIAELRIEEGSLTSRVAGGEPDFMLEGLDLALDDAIFDAATGGLAGLSAQGTMRADRLVSGSIVGRDAAGTLRVGDGKLTLSAVEIMTDQGPLILDPLAVGLDEDPFPYRIDLAGDLDLDNLLGATKGGFGRLRLELEADGKGPESARLEGRGRLRFEPGTIAETPLIQAVESLIGDVVLSGKQYQGAEVRYRIAGNRIDIDPFDLLAEQTKLGSGGWIGLDGSLGLLMHLHLPRAAIRMEELPRELLDALTGDDGLTAVPLAVSGTLESPQVTLDQQALAQAAKTVARGAIEREATKLLGRLLGGDDDDG